MNALAASMMESESGLELALTGVRVDAHLHDLVGLVTLEQSYANEENQAIEAVYSFPLPLDAVLLGLEVELGGRRLKGVVLEKKKAEENYEEAVSEGNGAIMLEMPEPGLYTMNVGNLKPKETAKISIRFALLNRWQGDSLRFSLPTCIAPRYGDPHKAGLIEHQIPDYTLSKTAPFSMRCTLGGLLCQGSVSSPTHLMSIQKTDGELLLTLDDPRTMLDRDVVLVVRRSGGEASSALIQNDFSGASVLATFNPVFKDRQKQPVAVKILVDCSGSMAGTSIAQAKEGVRRILGTLEPSDLVSMSAFGSSFRHFQVVPAGMTMAPATPANINILLNSLKGLNADLGGTELFSALDQVFMISHPEEVRPDILLITDGEVFGSTDEYLHVKKSGHRIMSVGVGLAAAESVVRRLAEHTGGACELVTPNEDMAERIFRHFQRLRLTRVHQAEVLWPGEPLERTPKTIEAVYDGDTLQAMARFHAKVSGEVVLKARLADGTELVQRAWINEAPKQFESLDAEIPGVVSRLVAHGLRQEALPDRALELALQYQLMGQDTNYLVVDVRPDGEKTDGLPALRKIPQMVAAGWGGLGVLGELSDECCMNDMTKNSQKICEPIYSPEGPKYMRPPTQSSPDDASPKSSLFEIPMFLRQSKRSFKNFQAMDIILNLSRRYPDNVSHQEILLDPDSLEISQKLLDILQPIIDQFGENVTMAALLEVVMRSKDGKFMSRSLKRLVKKTIERLNRDQLFASALKEVKALKIF